MTYRVPARIHHELCNWSAWCWRGPWPHPLPPERCASAEGAYRAPPEYDDELAGALPPARVHIIESRARQVQGVWAALPDRPRLILKAEYPDRNVAGYAAMLAVALNAPLPGRDLAALVPARAQLAQTMGLPMFAYEDALRFAVGRVEVDFEVRN